MTSIKDVAAEVGMSTATVSRALHGLPRVSSETRGKVLEAAQRLGYVPSSHAASLASGQTRTVAVVVPFVTRWFFASVVHGAEQLLRENGYDLLLYNLAGDPEARRRVFQTHLLGKRVDAVLILSLSPTEEEVTFMERLGRPVALVGAEVDGWPSVGIDDAATARTAVEHLASLGHERIAFVGGALQEELDFAAPLGRLNGFEEGMTRHGLEIREGYETVGYFTVPGGAAATEELLALAEPPTAIFAASDEMAMGVMWAVRQAGLRVPEDVSVVGVDDHEMAEYFGLTTVAQPVHDQGRIAAEQVLAAIEAGRGAGSGWEPARVTVPVHLVERHSTAPPCPRA